jgi:drug/metabolite transporter (DMT)-like permease
VHARPSARRTGALLWVAFGAGLWGTDTVLRRPLVAYLGSIEIVLIEHLVLALVLAPVLLLRRKEWTSLAPRDWAAVAGVAWGGSALGTVLFTEAIRAGNPTTAVLLQKMQPIFAALLARAVLGEPLTRRFWTYLGIALSGAYLVSFGWRAPATGLRALPAALALGAAACWGSSTVLGRFVLDKLSFPTLTALRIVVAAPLLLALVFTGPSESAAIGPQQWVALALLALVPGLAALLAYYRGLKHTRASLAAVAELSFPAVAALLNWTVLGARVSGAQIAGFCIIWWVIWRIRK